MQLFLKVTVSDARCPRVKTEFNIKWSFKVTRFGISKEVDGGLHIATGIYNNVGLISTGSEDIMTKSTENEILPLSHCQLTPPLQGIPANIQTNRNYSHWATASIWLVNSAMWPGIGCLSFGKISLRHVMTSELSTDKRHEYSCLWSLVPIQLSWIPNCLQNTESQNRAPRLHPNLLINQTNLVFVKHRLNKVLRGASYE